MDYHHHKLCHYLLLASINVLFHYHPLYLQAYGKNFSISNASLQCVTVDVCQMHDRVDVTENLAWNYAYRFTEAEWKELGLGGIAYDCITNPTVKAIRDHPDSIGDMSKKELHKILPVIAYNENYRVIIFRAIQVGNRLQSEMALNIAKARHTALGYDDANIVFSQSSSSSSSSCSQSSSNFCSVSSPPLVIANTIFDRGTKRKTDGGAKSRTKKSNKIRFYH